MLPIIRRMRRKPGCCINLLRIWKRILSFYDDATLKVFLNALIDVFLLASAS